MENVSKELQPWEYEHISRGYYIYAYLREDGTPYYVGKGRGNRLYDSSRRIKIPEDRKRVVYLRQNLTEDEAYKLETEFILRFGRKDNGTGILRNESNGGKENHEKIVSQETRDRISKSNTGKKLSEETKQKLSVINTGKKLSAETRQKMSARMTGEKHPLYGKPVSEETRRKISESHKGSIPWNKGKFGYTVKPKQNQRDNRESRILKLIFEAGKFGSEIEGLMRDDALYGMTKAKTTLRRDLDRLVQRGAITKYPVGKRIFYMHTEENSSEKALKLF
jgi:hypothetical protein